MSAVSETKEKDMAADELRLTREEALDLEKQVGYIGMGTMTYRQLVDAIYDRARQGQTHDFPLDSVQVGDEIRVEKDGYTRQCIVTHRDDGWLMVRFCNGVCATLHVSDVLYVLSRCKIEPGMTVQGMTTHGPCRGIVTSVASNHGYSIQWQDNLMTLLADHPRESLRIDHIPAEMMEAQ
jgi:hypothetical protein